MSREAPLRTAGRRHVSVVLPTRNRADTIARAVRSVLAQTYSDLELIVVDDCSGDETLAVLGHFEDERLRVVELSVQQGVSGARNAGLDVSRYSLIAFQDSDDVWMAWKLERQIAVMESLTAVGVRVAGVGCRHVVSREEGHSHAVPLTADGPDPDVSLVDRFGILAGCIGGDGTPKLLIDLTVGDPTVRFDVELPAIEDRDFLFRTVTGESRFAVVEEELITVTRGRMDHAATAVRSATAYRHLLDKYSSELSSRTSTRDWYSYLAAREMSSLHAFRETRHLLRQISQRRRWLRVELLLGATFGHRGLALAARLGIRPNWRDRCSDLGQPVPS